MEKGGLSTALAGAGVIQGKPVGWADEMRLGLLGRVRRVWGIRGIRIGKKVECTYQWRYLSLAVAGVGGQLWWTWIPNLKKETVQGVVKEWQEAGLGALVWDRAPSHQLRW
jgi:hypothetical protein